MALCTLLQWLVLACVLQDMVEQVVVVVMVVVVVKTVRRDQEVHERRSSAAPVKERGPC